MAEPEPPAEGTGPPGGGPSSGAGPSPQPGGGEPAVGGGLSDGAAEARFLDDLAGWAAGQRVVGAAAGRTRLRALADAAAGSATLTGVLVDLAERRAEVTVSCAGPTGAERLSGRLVGVGRDFAVIEQQRGRPAIVRLDAVTSVWPAAGAVHQVRSAAGRPDRSAAAQPGYAGARRPAGDRSAPLALSLEAVLADLAEQGAALAVVTATGVVEGELLSVGRDVMTLRSGGPARRVVHVPTAALRWCELR